MIAEFTFDEMVYNSICSGKQIWYDDDADPNTSPELKTIDYVKLDKKTRQIIIHCTDGDIIACLQDDIHQFEVTSNKVWKKTNRRRMKGG